VTQLAINHVGKTYADGTEALRDVQVHAAEGEIVAILGGSGCGKTTLLRLVAGLDVPSLGAILVGGEAIAGTHPAISAVFQEPRLLPWLKVGANIAFGGQRLEQAERQRRTGALLDRIGLSGYGGRWPRDLSGGQSQRVAIARALIGHPGVLLLDEPFSALDPFTRTSLHELVLGLWKELKPTILMVTHDVDEAVTLADRVVVMKPRPGRVHESMQVDLPRPRDKLSSAFELMKRRVMRAIDRSLAEERPREPRPFGPGGASPWL
jgi:sulfonate transport system ATP-binding protein